MPNRKETSLSEVSSACRKSSPAAIFSAKTGFHCTFGAAVKTCKETLLRKASDLTAHVAEVGLKVRGLRPSDTSQWVYRQSEETFLSEVSFLRSFPRFQRAADGKVLFVARKAKEGETILLHF